MPVRGLVYGVIDLRDTIVAIVRSISEAIMTLPGSFGQTT